MENEVGTVDGSGNEDFELKQEKVDMEGSNRLKDLNGDDVFQESSGAEVTCIDTGEKRRQGYSLEAAADGVFVGDALDKFEEAVDDQNCKLEEDVNVDEVDVTVNTDDGGVDKEADRDVTRTGGVLDDGKDCVRDVPESVTASVVVSDYGVGGSEDSNVVIGNEEGEGALRQLNAKQVKRTIEDIRPETRPVVTAPAPTPVPTLPAGLGGATPLLKVSSRVKSQTRLNGTDSQVTEETLHEIRVKFLRLALRLGQTQHNDLVANVLKRLYLAEHQRGGYGGHYVTFIHDHEINYDREIDLAKSLEKMPYITLDFTCTILVLGKTGVGKSATINSIFDRVTCGTDAFELGTKSVREVVGTVNKINVRLIDTPGLLPSRSDQRRNVKMLESVRQFIRKSPPDVVLYLDRLDTQICEYDYMVLRTITDTFGLSIWTNAIVVLTNAASAPPEDAGGVAFNYDMFVKMRAHDVQKAIRHASRNTGLLNPVSLVENHSACRKNIAGQRVLPNGQVWKPHLLLCSFASKIMAEADTLLKLQDGPPEKPCTARAERSLLFLLSSLLRSRPQLKLPNEQYDDDDLDGSINSDDECEYDELPSFRHLTRAQLAKLSKSQQKAFYDELEYREKLFKKKQLREEKQRRRMMKNMEEAANGMPTDCSDGLEEVTNGETSVSLPASFDSDNPTYRYRFCDTTNQWLVRPVHGSHSWDHDVGYEGLNMEMLLVTSKKVPMSFSGQVTKEKKEAHFQMEVAGSVKHNKGQATTLSFDMQQIERDIAYTLRTDTEFSNFRSNKVVASLSVTHMGDAITAGGKVVDKLMVTRRAQVVMSGGATVRHGDIACGGSLKATLRDQDFPLGRFLSTMSVSMMNWHGEQATTLNAQTQIPIGRLTDLIGSVNYNTRGQGQVSIRFNSSDHLQIALIALIPLFRKLLGYSQQLQFKN